MVEAVLATTIGVVLAILIDRILNISPEFMVSLFSEIKKSMNTGAGHYKSYPEYLWGMNQAFGQYLPIAAANI